MKVTDTERLIIRHLEPEDDTFLFELMNSPTWLKYIGDRHIYTTLDARNYLVLGPIKSYEMYGVGMYGMVLKETQELIGVCGIVKRDYLDDFDLGYALLPEYEGKGFAFEASQAVLSALKSFPSFSGKHIVAFTTEYNKRSRKLLDKLGFTFERVFVLGEEECMLYGINV